MLSIESFIHNNFDKISNYGSPITDFRVNCPFCEDNYGKIDNKQKLHVSLNKHVVHCFRCGYKKNWIGFVMDVLSCNYYQALGELYALPNPKNTRQIFRDLQLPIGKPEEVYNIHIVPLRASDGCSYLSAGRKYARNRGLTEVQWDLYKLGVSTDLPYRLIIPVEDDYYQARAFYGWQEPKYLNPKIPSENCIFNSNALVTYDEVVVCEGAISAMCVGMNAIATLGIDVTKEQLNRLINAPVKRYIIAFDAGTAKMSTKFADRLVGGGKEVKIWRYNDGDPADTQYGYVEYEYTFKNKLELLFNDG